MSNKIGFQESTYSGRFWLWEWSGILEFGNNPWSIIHYVWNAQSLGIDDCRRPRL